MFNKLIKKININMTKSELQELILSEKKDFTIGVKEIVERIKDGEEKEELYNQIKAKCENNIFIDLIDEIVAPSTTPYIETCYFRQMNTDDFSNLVDYMLNNAIIQCESKEIIINETKLDSQNIDYVIKLLNTVLEWIIVKRYTFGRFTQHIYHIFRFDEKKAEILWDLFVKNKQELINIIMFENHLLCKNIKTDISKLINIFTDLFEEDEEAD